MADTAIAASETEPRKPMRMMLTKALRADALKPTTYARAQLFCLVSNETTFEEVMTPSYWQNHVSTFIRHPHSLVEVVREDSTMDLLLRAVSAKPGMVVMRCLLKFVSNENLGKVDADAVGGRGAPIELPEGYKWTHVPRGDNRGHMIRLPNSEVLVQGMPSKQAAADKAWEHFRAANTPQV